jgi:hypothetical protein
MHTRRRLTYNASPITPEGLIASTLSSRRDVQMRVTSIGALGKLQALFGSDFLTLSTELCKAKEQKVDKVSVLLFCTALLSSWTTPSHNYIHIFFCCFSFRFWDTEPRTQPCRRECDILEGTCSGHSGCTQQIPND